MQDLRPFEQRTGGEFVIGPLIHEGLHRGLEARVFGLAAGDIAAPDEAREVGVEQRGGIGVLGVEAQEFLIKADGLERRGVGVGGRGLPREERRDGREDWTASRNLERVGGPGRGLFARGVKMQRIVRDEVVERRAVSVGEGAFLEQRIEGRDGRGL